MRQLFILLTLTCSALFAQAQFPSMPDDPVMDNAHVLNVVEIDDLNEKIKAFEQKTSMHIKVVTVEDVTPYSTVSDYTVDLYHHWQLGDPIKHNGLMLVYGTKIGAASNDMKDYCRIMTGYGTMKILSDDYIIHTVKHGLLMPNLRDNPAQAFNLALDNMFSTIEKWNEDHRDDMTARSVTESGAGTGGTMYSTTDSSTNGFWSKYKWWIIGTIIIIAIIIFLIVISNSDDNNHHYSKSSRSSSSSSSSGCSTIAIFSCSTSSSSGSTSSCSSGGGDGGGGGCGGGGCGGGGCGG